MSPSRILAAVCAAALLLAGCGAKSNTAQRGEACTQALRAKESYRAAEQAMGLNFANPATLEALKTTYARMAAFRARIQALQRFTAGAETERLDQLRAALTRQERAFKAVVAHDLATARREAAGLNAALATSLANLERICAKH